VSRTEWWLHRSVKTAFADVACAVGWVNENVAHYSVDSKRVAL
jgi:hypothetical protein